MRAEAIPDFIAAAGPDAARAYRAFLAAAHPTAAARARRFARWATHRGLTPATLDASALVAYRAELALATSAPTASVFTSGARALLRHLARAGVLPSDPCPDRIAPTAGARPALARAELERLVLAIGAADGWTEGCADFRAGLVLLAPGAIGTIDPAAVAAYTGVPEPEVREFAARLLANGVWKPDGTIVLSGDEDLALMLDVWVAMGMLERTAVPAAAAEETGDRGGTRS